MSQKTPYYIDTVALLVIISAEVGFTNKEDWIVRLYVFFCMWSICGIAVLSSFLRGNNRNLKLFTFTSLNAAYGAYNCYYTNDCRSL